MMQVGLGQWEGDRKKRWSRLSAHLGRVVSLGIEDLLGKAQGFQLSLCRSERLLGKGSSVEVISVLGARGSLGTFGH